MFAMLELPRVPSKTVKKSLLQIQYTQYGSTYSRTDSMIYSVEIYLCEETKEMQTPDLEQEEYNQKDATTIKIMPPQSP